MQVMEFINKYWTQILFIVGVLTYLYQYIKSSNEAMKCSLRNDILTIYENCRKTKTITMYQLQAINYSYEAYKKLKGNSFVSDIVEQVKKFEIVD